MNQINKQSVNLQEEKLKELRRLMPQLFDEKGLLDIKELELLRKDYPSSITGKYEFNWAGKMSAKRNAYKPSRANLRPDRARSINFDSTENLIIEGDNLEVLKLLQKSYANKIKCIYIDPPYNTGHDFVYSDDYSEDKKAYWEKSGTTENGVKIDSNTESQGRYHSNWLNMMYPRLVLAREFLRDDGFVFVSIDDNEVHNLKKIMDEVFGEENFISLLSVENNPKGRKNSDYISVSNDYCLIYAKFIGQGSFVENIPKPIKDMTLDEKGRYVHNSGKRVLIGENTFNKVVTDLKSEKHYSAYINTDTEQLTIEKENSIQVQNQELLDAGYKRYISVRDNEFIENTYTVEKFVELFEEGALDIQDKKIFEKNFSSMIRLKSIVKNRKYKALINGEERMYKLDLKTSSGSQLLKDIFKTDKEYFPSPKSIGLLKLILTLFDENDYIVLDFFAGSGTTAHAVMDLNKEDGGNRKYILVQLPELTKENSEAHKAGFNTISDITIERVKRVSEKIKKEDEEKLLKEGKNLDLGFKVFKLAPSFFPENQFTPDPEKTEEENIEALDKYLEKIKSQTKFEFDEEELLFEILLKDGFKLNFTKELIGEIKENKVYKVMDGDKEALVCLDDSIDSATLKILEKMKDMRFICLERAVDTTKKWNLKSIFGQNLWVI